MGNIQTALCCHLDLFRTAVTVLKQTVSHLTIYFIANHKTEFLNVRPCYARHGLCFVSGFCGPRVFVTKYVSATVSSQEATGY